MIFLKGAMIVLLKNQFNMREVHLPKMNCVEYTKRLRRPSLWYKMICVCMPCACFKRGTFYHDPYLRTYLAY